MVLDREKLILRLGAYIKMTMKLLHYLSMPLKWPFYIIGGIFMGIGWCFSILGAIVHEQIEYRFWKVLHDRWCKENLK